MHSPRVASPPTTVAAATPAPAVGFPADPLLPSSGTPYPKVPRAPTAHPEGTENPGRVPPVGGTLHEIQPASPFAHPLSVASEHRAHSGQSPRPSELVQLTDAELAQMLRKARAEEKEYERGLREDPFVGSGPAKPGA